MGRERDKKMQLESHQTLYLYPHGEDTQAAWFIIKELQRQNLFPICEIVFVDDKNPQTSLENLRSTIIANGVLWILHQDREMFRKLCANAADIPFIEGIENLKGVLHRAIEKLDKNEILQNHHNDATMLLNYASYFMLHFWISLNEDSLFVQIMKRLSEDISAYFAAQFCITNNTIAIASTHFSSGKHLGEIGKKLESMGQKVVYVVNDEQSLQKLPENAICCPLQLGYMGILLRVFRLYVTCQMPLTAPNWGQKVIYVSHAYIDPIAALAQRNRPLDDFWFSKKMGINGYRMVPSMSNYLIFKDKFAEHGYQNELVCAGYPSLDSYIAAYHHTANIGEGAGILIAINEHSNVRIIYDVLQELRKKYHQSIAITQKIIFRPHPSFHKTSLYNKIYHEFHVYDWFVYDTSARLSAETMHACGCLIGDFSSLVYTFPLCTLKPAILLISKESLQNTYNGVGFYNPILHFYATNVAECLQSIETIAQEDKQQRAQNIKEFREKEVFHLGDSSTFIAAFIAQKLQETL